MGFFKAELGSYPESVERPTTNLVKGPHYD
jgi:hypothetical protein